ncbi:MAG: type IV secretory system conjugative DNA transfer family protein [Actinomycetia bacterium]|nr:type IV secretory system conjugative DNA transfer family protein [Actinomycetes bacterium]
MRRRGTIQSGGRSIPVTWLDPVAASPIEIAVGGLFLVLLGLLGLVWGAGFFSSWLVNGEPADLSVGDTAVAMARMGGNKLRWEGSWPPELEEALAGPIWFWFVFAIEVVVLGLVFWPAWRLLGPRVSDPSPVVIANKPENHPRTARRQAAITAREERQAKRMMPMTAAAIPEPPPSAPGIDKILVDEADGSRLILGRVGNQLVATDKHHSVLALGPTQSGKSSGLALPAILEWKGPVVVTAAKSDLVSLAWNERAKMGGRTWLFDPTSSMPPSSADGPDLPRLPPGGHGWSPIEIISAVPQPRNEPEIGRRVRQWGLARQSARWMVSSVRAGPASGDLPHPWFGAAEQMLAPMLLAVAAQELSLGQLSEWIDRRSDAEVTSALERTGVEEALAGWEGAQRNDPATLAGCYQILTAVMYPFVEPMVLAQARDPQISADGLLDSESNTLFILSPPHHQERLRPLMTTIVSEVIDNAMSQAAASPSGRLDNPLLVVLDDAATSAPIELLDQLASMGAGLGIQLLTLFQDLSHLSQSHGREQAIRLANNHRARVVLPGITDNATLDYLNPTLRGNRMVELGSGPTGGANDGDLDPDPVVSQTATWMRTLEDGVAVLIYGNLPPMRMMLRPWFADKGLHGRIMPEPPKIRRSWFRRREDSDGTTRTTGFPNPFDSEANDAEAKRYWDAVSGTGLLPEPLPFDDGTDQT